MRNALISTGTPQSQFLLTHEERSDEANHMAPLQVSFY